MLFSEEFLQRTFLSNSYLSYLLFFTIILFGWIVKRRGSRWVSRLVFRFFKGFSKNAYADEFVELLRKPFEVFFALLILYLACTHLEYPTQWHLGPEEKFGVKMTVTRVFETLLGAFITWIFLRITDFIAFVQTERSKRGELKADAQLISFLRELCKVALATIGLFSILSNVYDLNITAIITSLGIGGFSWEWAAGD